MEGMIEMAKNAAIRNACKQAVTRLRSAEQTYRLGVINALQPLINAYLNGTITLEEYEAATGETYAQTLQRQFTLDLANAKDRAMADAENGKISEEDLKELLARFDAAGAPESSSLVSSVTIPPEIPDDPEDDDE